MFNIYERILQLRVESSCGLTGTPVAVGKNQKNKNKKKARILSDSPTMARASDAGRVRRPASARGGIFGRSVPPQVPLLLVMGSSEPSEAAPTLSRCR